MGRDEITNRREGRHKEPEKELKDRKEGEKTGNVILDPFYLFIEKDQTR